MAFCAKVRDDKGKINIGLSIQCCPHFPHAFAITYNSELGKPNMELIL